MLRHVFVVAAALMISGCSGGGSTTDAAKTTTAATPPASPQPAQPAAPALTPIEVPEFTVSTSAEDIAKGKEVFAAKGCVACHKADSTKLVGPGMQGVFSRRDETWIKKMILRPDIMVKEDPVARKLLAEHMTPMPAQGVDPKEHLPYIMAYLKSLQ